jgi:hypothetical protein
MVMLLKKPRMTNVMLMKNLRLNVNVKELKNAQQNGSLVHGQIVL